MISLEECQEISDLYGVDAALAKEVCGFCQLQEADRDKAILSAAGRIRSALRRVRGHGKSTGRPPGPKCACGAMTAYQARKKRHVCVYEGPHPAPRDGAL